MKTSSTSGINRQVVLRQTDACLEILGSPHKDLILSSGNKVGILLSGLKPGSIVIGDGFEVKNVLRAESIKRIIDNDNELLIFLLENLEIFKLSYSHTVFNVSGLVTRRVSTKGSTFIVIDIFNGNEIRVLLPESISKSDQITKGSYIQLSVGLEGQGFMETQPPGLKVILVSDLGNTVTPIQREEIGKTVSERFSKRHIDLRGDGKDLLRYRSSIIRLTHEYFQAYGFTNIDSPKIIGKSAEGPVDAIGLKFFNKDGYLALSDILAHMLAISGGFNKVYEIGPNFRQDPSRTKVHSSEFTTLTFHGVNFKMEDIIRHINNLLRYLSYNLTEEYGTGLVKIDLDKEIPILSYREVEAILQSEGFHSNSTHNLPKSAAEVIRRRVGDLLWITHQPAKRNPIYTKCVVDSTGEEIAHECELWSPRITSVADGGERVTDSSIIKGKIIEKGLNIDSFDWLLKMVENGIPQHGGIGMGMERLSALLLGVENVRDLRLLYRDFKTIEP